MKAIWQICRREFKFFFVSPRGYVVMAAFLFLQGWIFNLIVSAFSRESAPTGSIMQIFLGGNIFFWIFLFLVLPVMTMGLLAEERRTGTLELLLTAPVTEGQVILGKFFGAFLFYTALWIPTLLYPFLISYYSKLDWWPIIGGYIYLIAVGAPFVALGVFCSTISKSQIAAAILTFSLMFLLFLMPIFLKSEVTLDWLSAALRYMDLWDARGDYGKGIIDSRLLVYTVTSTLLLLIVSTRTLEVRKAR